VVSAKKTVTLYNRIAQKNIHTEIPFVWNVQSCNRCRKTQSAQSHCSAFCPQQMQTK